MEASATKEYHYFMSHKKMHSRDGSVHAEIAQYFVDSLFNLNYTGFFDVDHLEEISAGALREALQQSGALVVLLNDETHMSDWCQLEWTIAGELELPVKVIIDMERASKSEEILRAQQRHPHLLTYQWTEYTSRRRREALSEVAQFLSKHSFGQVSAEGSRNSGLGDDPGESPATSEATHSFVHPAVNKVLIMSGLREVRSRHAFAAKVFRRCIVAFSWISLIIFFVLLVYATGPAFTDHMSTLSMVFLHVYILLTPMYLRSGLRSDVVKTLMSSKANHHGTAAELAHRVHKMSFHLFMFGCLSLPLVLGVYLFSWTTLFLSDGYLAKDRSDFSHAFGMSSGVLLFMGFSAHIPLAVCMIILSALLKLVSTIGCEGAPDSLNPQIAALGVHRRLWLRDQALTHRGSQFILDANELRVSMGEADKQIPPIILTTESKRVYFEHWRMGWMAYEQTQANLCPVQDLLLVWSCLGLMTPTYLAIRSAYDHSFTLQLDGENHTIALATFLHLFLSWVQAPIILLFEAFFAMQCTERLERVAHEMKGLCYFDANDYHIISTFTYVRRPYQISSLGVPGTRRTFVFMVSLLLLSAIPWSLVRFTL